MPAGYSTTVGFDAITVALLGRSNPWGVLPASLLFGAMRAGARLMQIQAGVPAELVDIIQAIILLFLIIDVLLRKLPGLRAAKAALVTTDAVEPRRGRSRRRGQGRLMDALITGLYGIPLLGLVFQFFGYVLDLLPILAQTSVLVAVPDRPGGPLRRALRALRRGQHRHRGDHAGGRVRGLDRRRRGRLDSSATTRSCRSSASPGRS